MTATRYPLHLVAAAALLLAPLATARADDSFAAVTTDVNQKLVKLFGSGGYVGVVHYGTGILISPDGYILTAASVMLDTPDLRVHLADGRRVHAKTVALEPQLDVALLKIDDKIDGLAYFDLAEAARRPVARPGTGVLAFSNQFEIATHEEPMSVEHGVIAAYTKLHGRRGIFDAAFKGDVYLVDAITNNPGAAGGALTTRKGELLGIIGKELRNTLTDTWVNYAVPIQAVVEGKRDDQAVKVTLLDFVESAKEGKYTRLLEKKALTGPSGYQLGLILVPNVVDRTPPYVEEVVPGSPAADAGFRPDDLIVYVEGEQVISIKAFHDVIDRAPPGSYKVEVRRGDKLMTLELKLEEPKAKPAAQKP